MRPMKAQRTERTKEHKDPKKQTPTFLLELPLVGNAGQAKRIRGHLEVGRQFYNAVLSEAQRRLGRMQADPAWQEARAMPQTHKQQPQGRRLFLPGRARTSVQALALSASARRP